MPHLRGHSGTNWYYEMEGEGETLLFFHGWGVDHRIWRQQLKHFSSLYRVISFDLPGHGRSTWFNIPLTDMVKDLLGFFHYMKIDRFSIVGSSLGGLFALKIYELAPEKIDRLIFVGSMPKFAKSPDYPFGLDVPRMRKLGGQLQDSYPVIVDVFFRSLFTKQERQSRRFRWLQRFRQNENMPMKPALAEYLNILEAEDLRHVLTNVKIPMQFINGTEDEICCRDTVIYLQRTVPQARFDFFDECGHFPFLSKPHEFNQTLTSFLEESKQK